MSETGCTCCCHRRLPWSALEDAIPWVRDASGRELAKRLKVHPQMVSRWRTRGWVSLDHAEQVADALGEYPSAIWPEYMELAAA